MSLLTALKSIFGFNGTGKSSPNDRHLVCEDCKGKFVFDEGEQKFFKDKGFSDPKRCPRCRKKVRSRMRRRHRGGRDEKRGNNHNGNHQGGRRHSVIDGDSPYADER